MLPVKAVFLLGCLSVLVLAGSTHGTTAAEIEEKRTRLVQRAQKTGQPQSQHPADVNTKPWVETVSWHPRVQVYHNFMSDEECDHIVNISRPLMRRSTVVGEGGKSVLDTIRTSRGTFVRRYKDPVVTAVEERLELWSHVALSHQEDVQILRYSDGEKYGAHMDVLEEVTPRAATVLLYLHDTDEGGETAFPGGSTWLDPLSAERFGPFSECAQGSVAVKPRKGQAMIFFSIDPDGKTQDQKSLHTGCPVLAGVKWTGTVWLHTAPFRPESIHPNGEDEVTHQPEDCEDFEPSCEQWAKAGECTRNVGYMAGDDSTFGNCRKACNSCEVCAPNDKACGPRNRLRAGYPSLESMA